MKKIVFLLSLIVLTFFIGCTKGSDVPNVDAVAAPSGISAIMSVKQDNSGMVTITPKGEGITQFAIYYGDGTTSPTYVTPGKSDSHIYSEGTFQVRIVGSTLNGKKAETTLPVTVTFVAPTNFVATVTNQTLNTLGVDVKAKADLESGFKVYFGESPNTPVIFQEGDTVSHIYNSAGTYTVTVIAITNGVATSTPITQPVTVTYSAQIGLPLDFESTTLNYNFVPFDGGVCTRITNPFPGGINTSSKVIKMVKSPGQVWGGSLIQLSSAIDFSVNKKFKVKVYSPRVGAKFLLKVENATNAAISYEQQMLTTVANTWETLTFDYSAVPTNQQYHKLVFIFDNGTTGDGSPNFTFYFDDIILTN